MSVPHSRHAAISPAHQARIEALYREQHSAIRAYILRLTSDSALADDLAQETFVRALLSPLDVTTIERQRPWLFTIAQRVTIDALRHRALVTRHTTALMDPDWDPRSEDYERALVDPAATAEIEGLGVADDMRQALARLPTKYRLALIALYRDGVSIEAVAAWLGVPHGGAKMFKSRARRAFVAAYAAVTQEEPS